MAYLGEGGPGHIYTECLGHWDFGHVWCWHSGASYGCIYLVLFPTLPCSFLPPPRGRTWWGFPNSGAWPCCLLDLGTSLPLGLQDAGAGRNQYNVAVRSVCPGEGSPSAAGWMAQLVLFLIPYVLVKSKTFHTKLRKQNKGGCVLEQDSLGLKPSSPAVSYLTWGKFIACVKRG